ncbi:unnamed protein product [Musa acuminata subsp. malaccensis]|uniref:(wild Malaysian banana) hypothetical protein n=1 Tax=Musa acuminata subsp. malaccensis TaxID=214687 RepID=A0A804IS85_MUSAM|nr:unnamed protein product [Musa acuminata subsp. malaccensis]
MNGSNQLNIRSTNTSNVSKVRTNNRVAYKGCCFFSIGCHSSVSCFSIQFR